MIPSSRSPPPNLTVPVHVTREQSVGLCNEGVTAFLKAGDTKRAIDCCVLLNQWDQAVQLAQAHNFPQIEQLLAKYANHLLEKEKVGGAGHCHGFR